MSKDQGGLDFHCLEDFNRAYIAKLAWWVLMEPDLLWVKIFKAKFCAQAPFSHYDMKSTSSNGWREIAQMGEFLTEHSFSLGGEWRRYEHS